MSVGHRIKLAREQKGMTLDEVAKRCQTTKQTIYKYENDIVVNIPYDKMVALSKALDVTISYLFDWQEESQTPSEPQLTGVDKELFELLKRIPEDKKRMFLQLGRVFEENLNKE